MNRAFKIAGVAACFLAVLVMSGGHWLALQSFAWMRMTIEFSQEEGLRTALQKTFSGRHPCALCLQVQDGWQHQQEQEKKLPTCQTENLPEALWEWRALTVPPAPTFTASDGVFASDFYFEFTDSPPSPPPRA